MMREFPESRVAHLTAPSIDKVSVALFVECAMNRVRTSAVLVRTLYLTMALAAGPGLGLAPPSQKMMWSNLSMSGVIISYSLPLPFGTTAWSTGITRGSGAGGGRSESGTGTIFGTGFALAAPSSRAMTLAGQKAISFSGSAIHSYCTFSLAIM